MTQATERLTQLLAERYSFFAERFNSLDDIGGMVDEFYTDDVVIAGEGIPLRRGRDAMRVAMEEAARSQTNIEVDIIEARFAGKDHAYTLCNVRGETRDTEEVVEMKSLVIFRRIDGQWRCAVDFVASGFL